MRNFSSDAAKPSSASGRLEIASAGFRGLLKYLSSDSWRFSKASLMSCNLEDEYGIPVRFLTFVVKKSRTTSRSFLNVSLVCRTKKVDPRVYAVLWKVKRV